MLFIAFFASLVTIGQQGIPHLIKSINPTDSSIVRIQEYLISEIGTPITLSRHSIKKSTIGIHEQFDILVEGIGVHDVILKRNRYVDGTTTIQYPRIHFTSEKALDINASRKTQDFSEFYNLFKEIYNSVYEWVLINKNYELGWVISGQTNLDHIEILVNLNGKEISRKSRRLYSHHDTTILVNTFQPDPITSSGSETSFSLMDNDDANSARLSELMIVDSINARWDSIQLTWKLESAHAQAEDLYPPSISPPTSTDANFKFNRSETGFEYVNAYFHINRQHKHLTDLGFSSLVDYSIKFDAHGSSFEQSFFDPISDSAGQLAFGQGGVDDAEDADVIIHEYAHAISYDLAPGTVIGTERLAIEEGLCDFFAISYSREYSDYQRDLVFNWDGHNTHWRGRELTYSRSYPSDLENELYLDAPMWASAIADVFDYYGRDISETLLLTSMYSYFPNMSMIDAAQLYLKADTLLYNNEHSDIISILFCKRGLLPDCVDTLITDTPPSDPYVANHGNFSVGTGPLIVYPNGNQLTSVELLDLNGFIIETFTFDREQIAYELPPTFMARGVYFVRITTNEESFSYKVLKLK